MRRLLTALMALWALLPILAHAQAADLDWLRSVTREWLPRLAAAN